MFDTSQEIAEKIVLKMSILKNGALRNNSKAINFLNTRIRWIKITKYISDNYSTKCFR